MFREQADTIEVRYQSKSYHFPVVEGTEGERAVNISRLRAETGLITLDSGYVNSWEFCQLTALARR